MLKLLQRNRDKTLVLNLLITFLITVKGIVSLATWISLSTELRIFWKYIEKVKLVQMIIKEGVSQCDTPSFFISFYMLFAIISAKAYPLFALQAHLLLSLQSIRIYQIPFRPTLNHKKTSLPHVPF